MRRVVFNQKGGVGKSSIASNLAAISAAEGHATLLVDLDAQCNASQYLLGEGFEETKVDASQFFEEHLGGFMRKASEPESFVTATPFENLAVIKSSPKLADLQARLEAKHKIFKFKEALDILSQKYARIYVDTPPAYNIYTQSALIACNRCLIPFDCDQFSREALYTLMANVEEIRVDHNPQLSVEAIVVNQFVKNARLPQRVVDEVQAEGLPLAETKLGSSVKMRESHEAAIPLIHLAPKHRLTQEFVALYREIEGE